MPHLDSFRLSTFTEYLGIQLHSLFAGFIGSLLLWVRLLEVNATHRISLVHHVAIFPRLSLDLHFVVIPTLSLPEFSDQELAHRALTRSYRSQRETICARKCTEQ